MIYNARKFRAIETAENENDFARKAMKFMMNKQSDDSKAKENNKSFLM